MKSIYAKNKIGILVVALFGGLTVLTSCDDGYSYNKYEKYKSDGELQDAVSEWVGSYVERNCRVNSDRSISCR
jgi:hypothetical protein